MSTQSTPEARFTRFTAKVRLTSKSGIGETVRLDFIPDYGQGRNADWAVATPNMSLVMYVKQELADRLEPGTEYTLLFDPDMPGISTD